MEFLSSLVCLTLMGSTLEWPSFRLTAKERDLIHAAAGPAKASKYVRTLAVAAANGDEALVLQLLGGPAPTSN